MSTLFDDRIAARYDVAEASMYDSEVLTPTVDVLFQLVNGGRALEFAVGTGRVALALQNRGVDVYGMEISQAMVNQLRAKAGGDQMPVTVGDMSIDTAGDDFQLVYLVYNTITNLTTQDQQVNCFCNAAAHLKPGGLFLIEVALPQLNNVCGEKPYSAFDVSPEHIGIDEYDIVSQTLISHHLWLSDKHVEKFDSLHRYAWPAEYDLMARIAGMTLEHRWSNWQQQPFNSDSRSHISVWKKSA